MPYLSFLAINYDIETLLPYMETAIINAQKLDRINDGKVPSNAASGTKVHELILRLKPYLKN